MLEWINKFLAGTAFDAAIYSAGLASNNGLHQMEEPDNLQELAAGSAK